VNGELTDEDAYFVAQRLGLETTPSSLCPVIMTRETCNMDADEARAEIRTAFGPASSGADVMIVSGTGSLIKRGSMMGISGVTVSEMLDVPVLLVGKCESFRDADSIVAARRVLGDRIIGVILNMVPPRLKDQMWDDVVPCIEKTGLQVLGIMPKDPILNSVSVSELAEATHAEFLCGADAAAELVENFVVGAMGAEQALHYFRRTARKCVITGGDRSDIQLAALESPTRCLILTGDLHPSHNVLARAEELGVPVLLVSDDTLATVTTIEGLLGKLRVRESNKIEHAVEQFEAHLELAKLDEALGLK